MAAPNALQSTVKLYQSVVEDVVSNVKEAFLDEGVDEAVLHEFKTIWENKILATKVVDSLDPNYHQQKSSSNSTSHSRGYNSHHVNASTSHLNVGNGRQFTSKIKSQSLLYHQSAPQVVVVSQHQGGTAADYNPYSALRSLQQPANLEQTNHVATTVTGRTIGASPLGAFIRGLPQSVISTPQHMLMQMPGGTNVNVQNAHKQGLLPPPLTSAAMIHQQGQQHQQMQINNQQRFDKIANSSTVSNVAPGSNVIVLPPHLQHLTNNIVQLSANNALNNGASSLSTPSTNTRSGQRQKVVIQLDGPGGVSDDDEDEEFVEEDEDEEINVEDESEEHPTVNANEGDALNSEDDEVSNENADEMFEADDVVVCQFEKVNRIRNKWKFILKDGIINLGRKDYVFNKAVGEAEF